MAHRFVFLLICLFFMPALIFAQDGAALYRRHCAMCHEAGAQTRAPGCVYWSFTADAGVRAAITVGPVNDAGSYGAFVGDLSANVYALDAASGLLLWKTNVDRHRAARITGAPRLHAGKLYVPVASL